jgi:hypothetical protein
MPGSSVVWRHLGADWQKIGAIAGKTRDRAFRVMAWRGRFPTQTNLDPVIATDSLSRHRRGRTRLELALDQLRKVA